MKIEVQIPQQEPIDWNRKCYAILSVSQFRTRIWGVGRTPEEAKEMAKQRFEFSKARRYKREMLERIDAVTLLSPKFQSSHTHSKIQLQECDMKCVIYSTGDSYGDKFIFESADVPYKIKYTRRTHG